MSKTEVYSWRVSPALKGRLTQAAHVRRISLAELLDTITAEWLRQQRDPDDEARQRKLHEAAGAFIGSISGDDPSRSKRVSELVKEKLRERRRATQE